jgi:hypothetical protein
VTTNLDRAAERVDYRLNYGKTDEPRVMRSYGIDGPELPNAYYGRKGHENSDETGSGAWENPEHPERHRPEEEHIAAWFEAAIREAVHEAMEWFWVDDEIYLDPHGPHENKIHQVSGEFARTLLRIRGGKD